MGHPRAINFEPNEAGYQLSILVSRNPNTLKETALLIVADNNKSDGVSTPVNVFYLSEEDVKHIHDWTKDRLDI